MKRILIALLDFYKAAISPYTGARCRFTPTCSAYAKEAIIKHGVIKGTGLAIWRLLRCNPFCKGGYDPVP
ncbi:MAG: membrane protein insertion efficiency factor YidD [Eubacteriales bacterium]